MAKAKNLPIKELSTASGIGLKMVKDKVVIEYNPLKPGSVLSAYLLILLVSQVHQMDWEVLASDKVGDGTPMAFFKSQQKLAAEDVAKSSYPANSIFRQKQLPVLIWAASSEKEAKDWNAQISDAVGAKLIVKYNDLKDLGTRNQIWMALESNKIVQQWADSAQEWGACATYRAMLASESFCKDVCKMINGEEKKAEEAPNENTEA